MVHLGAASRHATDALHVTVCLSPRVPDAISPIVYRIRFCVFCAFMPPIINKCDVSNVSGSVKSVKRGNDTQPARTFYQSDPSYPTSRLSIGMSGVGTQGDPCTATIFCTLAHSHLLYSVTSSISLSKYGILYNVISSQ
jgi:hypothetical protein